MPVDPDPSIPPNGWDPLAPFRLDDRVAIVTGASAGLGGRFARVLHAAGASVALAARRTTRLSALADDLVDRALAVPCDVTEPAEIDGLVTRTLEVYGRIDILVNNAGTGTAVPALAETDEQLEHAMRVNVIACHGLARRAAKDMMSRSDGGAIVNITSVASEAAVGSRIPLGAYAASKGAVAALTRELAAQWAPIGVRVNAIAPGWFPTEMTTGVFADDDLHGWIRRRTPLGRGGKPHELDGALLFLASPASSYVTGQVLCVDGGWTAV